MLRLLGTQVFWALPIGLMGQAWKLGLWRVFKPMFDLVDNSKLVHSFATKYIYRSLSAKNKLQMHTPIHT